MAGENQELEKLAAGAEGDQAAAQAAEAKAAADKAAADLAEAQKGMTPEQIAEDNKKREDAAKAKADEDAKKAGDKSKAGAPEKYDLKFPEGVVADEAALAELTPILKAANVSNEVAQKLVDLQIKREQAADAARAKAWEDAQADWQKTQLADPEYGGSEEKLKENLGDARTFMKAFASPALIEYLDNTGFGDHPELVRMAVKAGKAMREGGVDGGRLPVGEKPKSPADVLYDKK